jgi:hypothetical protein
MATIQRQRPGLEQLGRALPADRKRMIEHLDNETVSSISILSRMIIHRQIPIMQRDERTFRDNRNVLRQLSSRQVSWSRKRITLLRQHTLVPFLVRPFYITFAIRKDTEDWFIRGSDAADESSEPKMSLSCQTCRTTFVRPYSLRRHMIMVHGHLPTPPVMESVPRPKTFEPKVDVESTSLVHPFTMMVCGPTGSGKTVWLQKLLTSDGIQPPVRRIVWCYGQWQPAYDQMSRTMSNIEFVRGIPDDLESESYFNPSVNNLIVLDDLMTAAKNDHRVGDLFTKGSHHRSLSTIYVVQNLFAQGRASRDVALNSQYLVLFNSPVDRHQISLLEKESTPETPTGC